MVFCSFYVRRGTETTFQVRRYVPVKTGNWGNRAKSEVGRKFYRDSGILPHLWPKSTIPGKFG
eukprot:scaffold28523_cov62-Cyclotella_meneghiniana.AAC.7